MLLILSSSSITSASRYIDCAKTNPFSKDAIADFTVLDK
jgi:hypothetical protein